MTASYGFFDDTREYSADEERRIFMAVTGNGYVTGYLNAMAPTNGPGLAITVDTGMFMERGAFWHNDAVSVVAFETADATNPRKDRVIVKLDVAAKTVTLTYKKGTAAGSPVAPTLTQNSSIWEESIATATINAGASVVASFTDDRTPVATTLHGIISGHVFAGLTTGQALRATGTTSADFGVLTGLAFANVNANRIFAGPASGGNGSMGDRLMVLNDLPVIPHVLAYHNTTQAMNNGGVENYVVFNQEFWDNDTMHDTGSNTSRVVATQAGFYVFLANAVWAVETTGSYRRLRLVKNHASYISEVMGPPTSAGACSQQIVGATDLAAGGYVELAAGHNATPATINLTAGQGTNDGTVLVGFRVGV